MMMPDIVESPSSPGIYYLLFGSGDREKPLINYTSAYATTQLLLRHQGLTDRLLLAGGRIGRQWRLRRHRHAARSRGAGARSTSRRPTEMAQAMGWYLPLNHARAGRDHGDHGVRHRDLQHPHAEVPVEGSCDTDLGTARVYNVRYFDAAPKIGNVNRSEIIDGGGLPPSPVAGMVKLDDEATPVPFLIGGDADSPLEGGEPVGPSTTTLPKSLTYWFIHK